MCLKMNEKVKIFWDMKIQTGKLIEQSRPDIVVLKKESRCCNIMDVLCHFDTCVVDKGKKWVDKCRDLILELKRI